MNDMVDARTAVMAFTSFLWAAGAAAQVTSTVPASNPAAPATNTAAVISESSKEAPLRIELSTSRPQLTVGEGIGVTAEITNEAGGLPIVLRETSVTLTIPPEMTGYNDTRTWPAYFPTEHSPQNPNDDYAELTLQPKNSYQVFWTPVDARPRQPETNATTWRRITVQVNNVLERFIGDLGFIFFTPGDYKLTAQVKYWVGTAGAPSGYRTTQKSIIVRVAAPQFIILLGAILGGLIGYFVMPRSEQQQELAAVAGSGWSRVEVFVWRIWRRTYPAFIACLFSAIVTILLARISDTPFPIKVTIHDIWGAITIGFFANYAGRKLLARFFGGSESGTAIAANSATGAVIAAARQSTNADEKEPPVTPRS